ncbi:MAG: diguanylate cyclase [Chloroflexi bacterium]|nr:diguanylate cyclase [Chloroflexota bacterium]
MPAQVLFADSDALLCVMARRALQERGYTVTIAHDGSEVLERFEQHAYAAIVLGLSLRLVDGVRALREIKSRRPDMPIILLSSNQDEDMNAVGNQGAFCVVKTPITDWDQFANTLAQAIQQRGVPDRTVMAQANLTDNSVDASTTPTARAIDRAAFTLLRLLTDMTRAGKPLGETLDVLLQVSAQIMETNHAALVLLEGDQLRVYRVLGAPESSHLPYDANAMTDDAFALRVADARRTLTEVSPTHGNATVIGTPLIVRDETIGVLLAYDLPSDFAAPTRVKWLELYAAYGALAIEMERLAGEYEQQLPTDMMTDTLKRAPFLDLADREFRRAWRYNQPITAIYVSLDNLAEIRSTNGASSGERALKLAAHTCRNTVRSIDLLCRYDDDAFAVLLLMTTSADARHVADRLRNGLASLEIANGKASVRVTASLGVSAYPREGCSSIFDLIAIAQEAQRAALRRGANQIVYV